MHCPEQLYLSLLSITFLRFCVISVVKLFFLTLFFYFYFSFLLDRGNEIITICLLGNLSTFLTFMPYYLPHV